MTNGSIDYWLFLKEELIYCHNYYSLDSANSFLSLWVYSEWIYFSHFSSYDLSMLVSSCCICKEFLLNLGILFYEIRAVQTFFWSWFWKMESLEISDNFDVSLPSYSFYEILAFTRLLDLSIDSTLISNFA